MIAYRLPAGFPKPKASVSQTHTHTQNLISEGTTRLLARATNARSLNVETLATRVRAVVDKYLLSTDASAGEQAINEFMDALHADDLCLIVACEGGDEQAWSDLVAQFGPTVRSAARSASSNEDAAEDLSQSIWAELHGLRVREDGRPSGKIAYYSGRGSLGGWLRAVVGQLAIDHHRKSSRLVQTELDTDFDRLARESHQGDESFSGTNTALNPENALSERRAAADVESALAHALRELVPEDRLLVKLYYFDGLRLREAGTVLGVHEATASRRLARIHSEVRERVEAILMEAHGWTRSETARSLSEAAMHLEGDLELMLTRENPGSDRQTVQDE